MRVCVGTAKGIVIVDGERQGAVTAVSAHPDAIACMAQSCDDPNIIYAGRNEVADAADFVPAAELAGALFRSQDGGRSWRELTPRGLRETFWTLAAVPDSAGGLWAGCSHGRLFYSGDYGDSFEECRALATLTARIHGSSARSPYIPHVSTVAFDPHDSAALYVGVEGAGAFYSADRGQSFQALDSRLPRDVHSLALAGADFQLIFATSGRGLYRSRDRGRSWEPVVKGINRPYLTAVLATSEGLIYTAGGAGPPATWLNGDGADALLFESRDGGQSFSSFGELPMARRGMIMQIVHSPWAHADLFAVSSDGSLLRWGVGERVVRELASKLPAAFALAILP
ncbi:MAG TPA: hypothetical protein VKV28_05405 [Candidatus Binataceae bacterium]|nr:hypothetical protein [Candidatus Binataceae bacterium]